MRGPTITYMTKSDRRHLRSQNTTRALNLQLESCRKDAALDGLILADDDGVCLATSGDPNACDEVAARLPFIGRKVPAFEGVMLGTDTGWRIRMRRIEISGADLYLCAIGDGDDHQAILTRSARGVSRIIERRAA